jgi:hypothetical protein
VSERDDSEPGRAADALAAHVGTCADCAPERVPLEQLRAILSTSRVRVDVAGLSAQTVARMLPELQRRARVVFRRQVTSAVLWAILPLPLVLVYDTYLLQLAHAFFSAVLPAAVATYLIVSCAAFLLLLFATTYAAIPLVLSRSPAVRTSVLS